MLTEAALVKSRFMEPFATLTQDALAKTRVHQRANMHQRTSSYLIDRHSQDASNNKRSGTMVAMVHGHAQDTSS